MKIKKILIVFFIIFFSLLLVNIHHLEETVLISFNSSIWRTVWSIEEIPFEITWPGFVILLAICLLFAHGIIKIIFNWKGKNPFINKVINILYEPFLILEKRLLHSESYKATYINFCEFIYRKIKPLLNIKNIILAYIIINILPRIFLGIFLLVDVFIYGKIANFYKYAFLTIIILLGKIIIHTFEKFKELCILKVESMCDPEGLLTTYLTPEEENESLDEEELYMLLIFNEPRIRKKLYRKIVEIQTFAQVFENKEYWVLTSVSDEYRKDFRKRHNIDIYAEGYLDSPQWNIDKNKMYVDMDKYYPLGIQISIFLFKYTYCVNSIIVKSLQLFTNILFLVSWSKILYINVSISNLGLIEKIIEAILSIKNIPVNPFG